MDHQEIRQAIEKSIETKQTLLATPEIISVINRVSAEMVNAFKNGKKAFFCGNGGSAADAQHLAAELSGRFYFDRDPLPAEALHVNTSFLTAVANDYSFAEVYKRAIKAAGREGDVLVGLSTSGNSANVVEAIKLANSLKMITVGFTGQSGGQMKDSCQYLIAVPSSDTPRIQEAHILVGHIICEIIEKELFGK